MKERGTEEVEKRGRLRRREKKNEGESREGAAETGRQAHPQGCDEKSEVTLSDSSKVGLHIIAHSFERFTNQLTTAVWLTVVTVGVQPGDGALDSGRSGQSLVGGKCRAGLGLFLGPGSPAGGDLWQLPITKTSKAVIQN